jgi:ankyrin repeat protein
MGWANIIIPLIRRQINERESLEKIGVWLKRVPPDLGGVYNYILSYVIPDYNQEQSFFFFQWVHLAQRPLTVTEMRHALAMANTKVTTSLRKGRKIEDLAGSNDDMKRRVKVLSGGLAEVTLSERGDETVQVVHQSVNDFLRQKGLAYFASKLNGIELPAIDKGRILLQCHARMYLSCLKYLATAELLPRRFECFRGGREEECIKDRPFLAYATVNLLVHAEKAASCRADDLEDEIQLLQQLFGRWIEIYRALDRYGEACPPTGTTVMHMAATANLSDTIENLASNNQNVIRADKDGNTPLHLAARRGHIKVAEILRDKGADVEAKNLHGRTALVEAASHGQVRFVEWLLQRGANINGRANEAGHAIQAASLEGKGAIVRILLSAGADVNAQGGEYGNALQAASWSGSIEIVRMLLDAKADVNAQVGPYGNALQAASIHRSAEVVRMLLNAKADVNAQGGRYGNALQAASIDGSAEVVRMLLNAKADVNAQGGQYGTPLLAAVHRGFAQGVYILLQAGADPDLSDDLHRTPLHIAASTNKLHIIRQFPLLASAINAQDKFSQTPLQQAVVHGHTNFALALLELGADFLLLDGYGRNILDWAVDYPPLVTQLRDLFPAIALTDNEAQRATVRRSICQISNTLLSTAPHSLWALLQQLGRYLLFLEDVHNARIIFQFHSHLHLGAKYVLTCDICENPIHGTRVICKVCVNLDLCLTCRHRYPTHGRSNPHEAHDVLEVPYKQPLDSQQTMERLNDLLRCFVLQPDEPPTPDSKITTVTDPPPNDQPVFLKPPSPQALANHLLVGLLVTSLCTWYFHSRK